MTSVLEFETIYELFGMYVSTMSNWTLDWYNITSVPLMRQGVPVCCTAYWVGYKKHL